MRIPYAGLLAVAAVVTCAGPAAAQSRSQAESLFAPSRITPLVQQAMAPSPATPRAQDSTARTPRRDSIWNGGLIGAAIGGVGGSALIVASSGGSDNIPRAMLNVCVAPALAGFAVGAIIDAVRN